MSGILYPIPSLGPFDKWNINLLDRLPVTKRWHRFIVVATDYLTKFVEDRALKTSVNNKVTRFIYERIVTRFGISLDMVSDNGHQFISEVYGDLMKWLVIKYRFTIKSSTNGLTKWTNKTLCSMIANEAETRANASDWNLKIHHAMWVYNSTFKTATRFFSFHLAYGIEVLFPIEYEFTTFRIIIYIMILNFIYLYI